jgi:hypothetical protein
MDLEDKIQKLVNEALRKHVFPGAVIGIFGMTKNTSYPTAA